MEHDGLDDILDGPTISLSDKEIEDLLGPSSSEITKTLKPVYAPFVKYEPTPLDQLGGRNQGNISLDSGISFSEFEGKDGGLEGEGILELRADLRNLPDRSAPLPSCLHFNGRYYSDPLRIGLAFRVARALGVLRDEDFRDPISDLRARARAGEAKRSRDDAARARASEAKRSRDDAARYRRQAPPRVDLRKTIEARAAKAAVPPRAASIPAASIPTPSPDHSLLERTAVEMFENARSARMEITTLRKEAEELRGERRALRDEIRGLREFMKSKGLEPPPWGPSFSMPTASSLRGKTPQQI